MPMAAFGRFGPLAGWLRGGGCLLLILLPGLVQPAQGFTCESSPWLRVWPSSTAEAIQPRQVFLFSHFLDAPHLKKELLQFGKGTEVYLWAGQDSVQLLVKEAVQDAEGKLQLLMQPQFPLQKGRRYQLRARRGTENLYALFEQPPGPGQGPPGLTRYSWVVESRPDAQPPLWTATPAWQKSEYRNDEMGNFACYASFSCPVRDSAAILVKATLRHQRTGRLTIVFLPLTPGPIQIGWGACGGAFRFETGETYTVAFEAVDKAGNRAAAFGSAITFQAPGPARPVPRGQTP